jgi:subtilisin family serine protease
MRVVRHHETIGWVELAASGRSARALADPAGARDDLERDRAVGRTDGAVPGEGLAPEADPRDEQWTLTSSIVNPTTGSEIAQPAWHFRQANFPAAWDVSKGAASVAVAVIDTEFWTEHPDLKNKLLPGLNLSPLDTPFGTYRTPNVRAQSTQESFHGTHVAGLVGAETDNVIGVSGAGFGTPVLPFKVDFRSPSIVGDITEAITQATRPGVVAINMSFGGTGFHPAWQDALSRARAAGIVPVAAASNDQAERPGFTFYPAAMQGVLAVGATTPSDQIAFFSSTGGFVDVSAPGDPVLSTWDQRIGSNFVNGYHVTGGTSMAAPLVSGLVALIKARRPDLTPDEVEGIITSTAQDRGLPGKDQNYGSGRIDAGRALAAAAAFQRPGPPAPPPAPPAAGSPPASPSPAGAPRRSVRMTLGARRIRRGRTVRISGQVSPAQAGLRLQVQLRRFGGRGFATVRTLTTRAGGRFATSLRVRRRGSYEIRVVGQGLRTAARPLTVR